VKFPRRPGRFGHSPAKQPFSPIRRVFFILSQFPPEETMKQKDAGIVALKQSVAELKETLTHLTRQLN
jgi:hypothetical protein